MKTLGVCSSFKSAINGSQDEQSIKTLLHKKNTQLWKRDISCSSGAQSSLTSSCKQVCQKVTEKEKRLSKCCDSIHVGRLQTDSQKKKKKNHLTVRMGPENSYGGRISAGLGAQTMKAFDLCGSGVPREDGGGGWPRPACRAAFIITSSELVWFKPAARTAGGNETQQRTVWRSPRDAFKHATGAIGPTPIRSRHTELQALRPNSRSLIRAGRKQRTSRLCRLLPDRAARLCCRHGTLPSLVFGTKGVELDLIDMSSSLIYTWVRSR